MLINHPAANPPFNIVRMSHVELGVTDVQLQFAIGYVNRDPVTIANQRDGAPHKGLGGNVKDAGAIGCSAHSSVG